MIINQTVHMAFLGPKGSYSHIALKKYADTRCFNKLIEYSCKNFNEILQLVKNKKAEYGILPIENSTSGSINEVYDLLQNTELFLIGEIHIPITHCILTIPNTSFSEIKKIYSHPQSFLQCSQFLKNFPKWQIIFCSSTADAMSIVSKFHRPNLAALGSAYSGEKLYGLQVLKRDLANTKNNTTRFIILSNKKIKINEHTPTKTMIKISSDKYHSNLFETVSLLLHTYGIAIHHTKLRPNTNNPKNETLFIDIQANISNQKTQNVLNNLQNITPSLKILGCYPTTNN